MRTLAILCFSALLCVAGSIPPARQTQFFQQPAAGGDSFYYPTNLPTQAASAWWVGDDYTTNSGMATIPERTGTGLDLTNTAGTASPLSTANALNGHRTLYFDGSAGVASILRQLAFTLGSQPYSFHAVVALTNHASAVGGIISATNNSGNNYAGYVGADGQSRVRAGATTFIGGNFETNKWMSIVWVFNGTSSQVWTNGVQLGSNGTVAANDWIGLEVGRLGGSSTFDVRMAFAELTPYAVALSSANISNLFSYSTNVYGFGY